MISAWHSILDSAVYFGRRFDEISVLEGVRSTPYLDTKGIPTVGIGFNLRTLSVKDAVFQAMNINSALLTDPSQQIAEQGYINQLTAAVQATYANNAALQLALNNIMMARSIDPLLAGQSHIVGRNSFEMQPQEIRTTFDQIIPGYENLVDQWLPGIPTSSERLALVSLAYNNLIGFNADGSFKSGKLRQAIINDDRAEAWYQIRYQSNGGASQSPGIANRRYAESDLFGLFENAQTTESEAKSIYRMYTAHRETILRYEQDFPPSAAISRTFRDESFVARNLLLTNSLQFTGAPSIDGEVLVGSDLQRDTFDLQPVSIPGVPPHVFDLSKNDLMLGEGGDDFLRGRGGIDVLYGGAGNDRLVGDAGNDFLFGGAGFDTYVWATGDDSDRIEDSDTTGVIVVNGQMLVGGIRQAGEAADTYRSLDGQYTFVQNGSTLTINNTVTIQNWQPGALGITLRDLSANPTDPGVPTGPFTFTVTGGAENNSLDPPGAGSSALYGNGGNDIFEGDHTPALGAFDDLLDGGADWVDQSELLGVSLR